MSIFAMTGRRCPILLFAMVVSACTPGAPHPADLSALQKTVGDHASSILDCYTRGRQKNPSLGGAIAVQMIVRDSGRVEDIRLTENALGEEVGRCVIAVFNRMPFPRLTRDTRYQDSFCFEPDPAGTRCRKAGP